jgi:hypothetical protein
MQPGAIYQDHQEEKNALVLQLKFSGSTPSVPPFDMRQRFLAWFQQAPSWMSTHVQPGCVELTVADLLPAQQYDRLKEQGIDPCVAGRSEQ